MDAEVAVQRTYRRDDPVPPPIASSILTTTHFEPALDLNTEMAASNRGYRPRSS